METKRVYFIMPNLTGGGAERVASILVNQFVEAGIDTTLVLVKNDKIEYKIDNRVKIDKSIMHESGTRNPIQQILDIRRYMKKKPCGTFISFLTYQNFYAALANIGQNHKLILSLRNAPDKIQGGGIIPKLSALISFALADYVTFQTQDAKNYYPTFIQKKGRVILNPLQSNLPEYDVTKTKNAFISFCRLERQKNLSMAINAFAKFYEKHPEYEYHIFGNGELKEVLEKQIQDSGLNGVVKIFPFKKNILQEAKNYRMFILSSDYEGLSNSMIEAVSMGIPSICTDCPIGGAKMVIKNGINGFLVPVGDCDAMANAMETASDITCYLEISKNAKKTAEIFSEKRILNEWIRII